MKQTDIYQLAKQIGDKLISKNFKLVTVESCTGGMLAEALTAITGSSAYFDRGFVTYSNESKLELVGVSAEILKQYGAVSDENVRAMVEGGLKHSHAQVGISITGIAGPGGGTPQKPVGTVYFGWKIIPNLTISQCKHFSGDRTAVRQQATLFALQNLLQLLKA
jgi:nicotinamide-nucleotide amidase